MKAAALALLLLAATTSDNFTINATSVNVAHPGTPVTIRILRWSTDDERAPMLAALNPAPPQAPGVARAGGPADAGRNPNPAQAGRGAAAGRGRGRGRGGAPAAPLSPIAAFTAALGRAPTVGYVWTSDITGYSIKYAWHTSQPDGTDRIVIASDRRLGAYSGDWKPASSTDETDYAFTLIELRVGPKGLIEGKTSLTNKIEVDTEAKTVALNNYAAAAASLSATSAVGRSSRPSR